ncbi:MAG: protein-ADP-ribose hydrolase [Blautia sp.]|nr:protein-ADP-ribose hydrolase [Lachnoclostridium sp.]MCM1212606.1 protein-ADP-ribose hydrolase [Blautia sp.]
MQKRQEQEERLDYLLHKFKEDSVEYRNLEVGDGYGDKRMALRSLMNIRMPKALSEEVLEQQDLFLQEEALEKGIVDVADIPSLKEQYGISGRFGDKLSLWQGDITRIRAGAIVNAANSQMLGCFVPCHKCIDNAIHSAAGVQLRAECGQLMNQKKIRYGRNYEEPTGRAMLTKGYNLPAEYVIHTVGPIVGYQLTDSLRQDLRNCYQNILICCMENGIRTVAFCCISTGEFHFPNDEAAEIAVNTVLRFLDKNGDKFERIIFNVFKEEDKIIYENVLKNQ